MMDKMTYTKALETVLSTAEMTDEVREKLEALRDQLVKRAMKTSGKPSKAQRETAEFTERVFAEVSKNTEPVRCGDVAEELGASGQKVSAALSKLVKAGRITKITGDKKVSLFIVASEDADAEETEDTSSVDLA